MSSIKGRLRKFSELLESIERSLTVTDSKMAPREVDPGKGPFSRRTVVSLLDESKRFGAYNGKLVMIKAIKEAFTKGFPENK